MKTLLGGAPALWTCRHRSYYADDPQCKGFRTFFNSTALFSIATPFKNQKSTINNWSRSTGELAVILVTLPPIVRTRLGMDQHAEQLRGFLLEANFQFGLDVMYTRERQLVRHRAVAGDIPSAAHPLELDVVHIKNLRKLRRDGFQTLFQVGVAQDLVAGFDGCGLALNVGEDRGNFRHVVADLRLEHSDTVVGFLQ